MAPLVVRVDLAAVPPLFFAAELRAFVAPVERLAAGFFGVERLAVPVDFGLVERDDALVEPPPSSSAHLPDSTRCAASATASAISEPSRVALDTATLAALDAVSAASMPASRILRRAVGLAAIAAAAAVRPAASISRLIAAFAILSTVLWVEFEPEPALEADDFEDVDLDPDEDFRLLDFAIANLP